MATSNFTVRIEPDIIDGDVSKVIGDMNEIQWRPNTTRDRCLYSRYL